MADKDLSSAQIAAMTVYVDIHMPPPDVEASLFIFGTNQILPIQIAAERYHRGLAPLIITTGGVNRHDGRIEGQWLRDELVARGVPETAIRVEDTSANTEQNVQFSLDHISETVAGGLPLVAISKWYHRRTIHALASHALKLTSWYAMGYEPIYGDRAITRGNWPGHPDGRRRVIREAEEIPRRLADGTLRNAAIVDGAWRPKE